jgi:lipoyl(octanoyl) transferase
VRAAWLPGLTPYADAHALQRAWTEARAADRVDDLLLLLEHPPTITVGRAKGAVGNVVAAEGVPVFEVERGGDVTWHGPGQLVAYPIVRLTGARMDLHLHLRTLEEAVIGLLTRHGLAPQRDARNTGVWLPEPDGLPRKVCSVGIACRRWVTWHGLALNVDIDLNDFTRIRPCGFAPTVMTSLRSHGVPGTPATWAEPLAAALAAALGGGPAPLVATDLDALAREAQGA